LKKRTVYILSHKLEATFDKGKGGLLLCGVISWLETPVRSVPEFNGSRSL